MAETLPGAERAIVEIEKLENYCLDPTHPRGRHKARVFRDALAVTRNEAEMLRAWLIEGARRETAMELPSDQWGRRWQIDIPVRRQERRAVIRSLWIVRHGGDAPRLVTCWVL